MASGELARPSEPGAAEAAEAGTEPKEKALFELLLIVETDAGMARARSEAPSPSRPPVLAARCWAVGATSADLELDDFRAKTGLAELATCAASVRVGGSLLGDDIPVRIRSAVKWSEME
jgi:hypothetical protein